jgi:hypothetical protein
MANALSKTSRTPKCNKIFKNGSVSRDVSAELEAVDIGSSQNVGYSPSFYQLLSPAEW